MTDKDAQGAADCFMEKLANNEFNKDSMEIPAELNIVYTQDEFHKMMTSHNSDISIDKVNFLDYPDIKPGL